MYRKLYITVEGDEALRKRWFSSGGEFHQIAVELFEREIRDYTSETTAKVIVELSEGAGTEVRRMDDVLIIPGRFDLDRYLALETEGKARFLVAAVADAIKAHFAEIGTTAEPIDGALDRLAARGYALSEDYGSPVRSPDKGRTARIRWTCDRHLVLVLALESKGGPEPVIPFAVFGATLACLLHVRKRVVWAGDAEVRVIHSNKEDYWSIPIDGGPVRYVCQRAEEGNAHMMCRVGEHYLDGHTVVPDYEEGMRWLRRSAAAGNERAKRLLEQHEKDPTR